MSHTPAHQLDDELWQSILCQLTLVDTLNFSRTCKRFWSVAQEDAVWHCLYSTEFGACPPLQQNKRWKTIFKRRAQEDRVRLRKKRQARILHLQDQAQTSSASLYHAKADLAKQRQKLKIYRTELQVLKQLRTTEQAMQCWTPSAVSKGFDTFLAQAPVESPWRMEQLQQLVQDTALHCKTLEKTIAKSSRDTKEAQAHLRALQA